MNTTLEEDMEIRDEMHEDMQRKDEVEDMLNDLVIGLRGFRK